MGHTQIEIAERIGISQGYLSKIFTGAQKPGKNAAKSIGNVTGKKWVAYLELEPERIKQDLLDALAEKK